MVTKQIKKIKNLFKSKDSRVLLENFISLSALQMAGMLMPLITLPYILRVLDFEKYGIIMLSASLTAYFQSVTDYSFNITATRDVAVFKKSPKKLNLIYSKVLTIKTIFLLFSLLIITSVILIYPPFFEERLVFFLSSSMLIGYALFPAWFFQGIEKMKYITILNVGIKLFFTICVFIFIRNDNDYWVYPLLQSGGFIFAGIAGQYILIKKYNLNFILLKPRIIKQTITKNFPIFVNQFFPTLYNNTGIFLLGIFSTTHLVGIYAAIKKVIDLAVSLLSIVSRVFFPFLNRRKNAFNHYKKFMLLLVCVMIIAIIFLNQLVFWYLNLTYEHGLSILIILSIGLIGYAFYDIWGLNFFIINRKDVLVMNNTIFASISGFILAFPLIYYWGIVGAAINLSIARW